MACRARVHCAWVDREGGLWAGTHAGLALLRAGRIARVVTEADGLPAPTVWSLCGDGEGRVWVGTKDGLAVVGADGIRPGLDADDPARAVGVHALCRDRRGTVWIGLVGGDIRRVAATAGAGTDTPPSDRPGGTDTPPSHLVYRTGARVRALWPDRRGRLWVGTSAGVTLLEEGHPRDAWTGADGLPAKEARALGGDREGRVWAGTLTGLALLEDHAAPVRALPRPATLVFACAADRRGRVWVGTDAGLLVLDRATGAPALAPALPPPLAEDTVLALLLDRAGWLWVGTERSGLWRLHPDSGDIRAHIELVSHVPVLCLEGEGRLWAAVTGRGLVCVDTATGAVLHEIGAGDGLPEPYVQGLATDRRGRLWAGAFSGGLTCIDPARGTVRSTLALPADDGAGERRILDLCRDATGLLWVATHGAGLVAVDPERAEGQGEVVRVVTAREVLPSETLYACRADRRGDIWLGTRRGVARYTPATGRCIAVGRSLGLPSEECNSHALFLDEGDGGDGGASDDEGGEGKPEGRERLWVGTVQGIGLIELAQIPADVPACAVHLTGVAVMGQDRDPRTGLEIEDSEYDVVFSYGAVTFMAAPQVVYRAQLVGLDAGWSAPTAQRAARYTALRPGAYTFRVAARNWGGQWSAPVEASFRVVRNRAAREMEEALERERIDKEVALATAAVFERLALQDGLTGLLNRRALDERLAQEVERARRHGHPLTVALGDIDRFKRINDTYGHQVGDEVLKAVARLCQATARGGDSVGRYGGEEIALLLPETTAAEGLAVCERLRRTIEGHDWASVAPGLRVTLSIGLSDRPDLPHPAALLADADAHLYRAKQGGRNRTCGANSPVHARLS